MRHDISFTPGSFHYNPPVQEARDCLQPSSADSSLAFPRGVAAGAAATDEQLVQMNKTVLDAFVQKAAMHQDNTKLTIDYYRDVLEDLAHFLVRPPQTCSLADLQRLVNSDDRHVEDLITKFNATGAARVTLGHMYSNKYNRKCDALLDCIFPPLARSAHSDEPIKLVASDISRQAERLIHAYENTPQDRTKLVLKTLTEYAGHLRYFTQWLDEKRYSGQPVSDEKNSLEKLGSLEKLCAHPDKKSVDAVIARFLQENENSSKFPKTTKNRIGRAVESFRKVMGSQESWTSGLPAPVLALAPITAAAPAAMSSRQFQLRRQFDAEAGPSVPLRSEDLQTEGASLDNNPLVQHLSEDLDDELSLPSHDSLHHTFLQEQTGIVADSQQPTQASQTSGFPVEAEQSPPPSQHSPQNMAVTGTALSEAPLAHPYKPEPEASGQQTDIALDHTPQAREVDAAAVEDQRASFEPEWNNIPFDEAELNAALHNSGNMRFDGDFFDFTLDEDGRAFQAASPVQERPLQPGGTVTSQAGLASSPQAELGTTHPRADVNPSSSSTAPTSLAPPRPEQVAFQRRLLGQIGEDFRLAQPDSLKRPAPEPQVTSRVVRPRTAAPSPLASPCPGQAVFQQRLRGQAGESRLAPLPSQQTTLQQRLLGQLGKAPSLRWHRGAADEDGN